ncbi:MAG: arginine deiminase [Bacteroidales bacterium]|jgi:arginine deiminase|nr:arginine deiminase [Bacteroidales bacterium]
MESKDPVRVSSEIGELETVIIHAPGSEVELMTPADAHEALYSDILNMDIAQNEHAQLSGVLSKISNPLFVKDLLSDIMKNPIARQEIIGHICGMEPIRNMQSYLESRTTEQLVKNVIEGVQYSELQIKSEQRFAHRPLYNLFFTRDASITVNNRILVADMSHPVRYVETLMMNTIYSHHPIFANVETFSLKKQNQAATIEGGDLHIVREDLFLLGIHPRTNMAGVQAFIETQSQVMPKFQLITFELPTDPASFIHLDMAFTMLNYDECMIYAPLILNDPKYRTLRTVVDGHHIRYHDEPNLLTALKNAGLDLRPIHCGGTKEEFAPIREQWHSGANFFCLAPGKVIAYGRNRHTVEALNNVGYEVIPSTDIISGKVDLSKEKKVVVTIPGAELSRGGGGCRCMTMPIKRKKI